MGILTLLSQFWGKPPQFAYRVTVTAGQSTTPKFTFAAGAPAAVVDWGDGTSRTAVVSGTELNHAYTPAGTFTVRLIAPNQQTYLTQIDINTDKVSQVLTPIQMFGAMTLFEAYLNNTLWTQNIGGWQFPPLLQTFQPGKVIRGDFSGLVFPNTMKYFNIEGCQYLTGSVSGLIIPNAMTHFIVDGAPMTGCPVLSSMVSIRSILVHDLALPQATVDLYLSRCVAVEAQTTYATPVLNLGGTNAAPSAQGVTDHLTLEAAGWVVTITA